jgi:Rieske Fe-S protein
VTQPTAGNFKAFTAVCTHAGCTVGSVTDGVIKCPCHGSMYSAADGSVKGGPAPAPLAAKNITVQGGEITLA